MLLDEDYVVIWDLESFTTALSELRWFLWWAARLLETDPIVRRTKIKVFDYRLGVIEQDIWNMIDEYNEEVNCYSRYSLHRLIDDIGLDEMEGLLEATHVNSGPLGIIGNIGFSTTIHGLNASSISKSFNAAATIGDDVLVIVDEDPDKSHLREKVRALGRIPQNKFGIFGPSEEWDENNGWKFVKRPLRRWKDGITIGGQLNFPILAYVYQIKSKNRKFSQDGDQDKIVHRFIGQVSSFLWDVQMTTLDVRDTDITLIKEYLIDAYYLLGLPLRGALPGATIKKHGLPDVTVNYAVPSLNFDCYDPRIVDWAEYLWFSCPQSYTRMPVNAGCHKFPEYDASSEIYATESQIAMVLQDLGYLTKPIKQMEWVPVEEDNYRRFREQLHGDVVPLVVYRWIAEPPLWYYDFLSRRFPIELERSLLEEEDFSYGIYSML
jgi:hypothetical protein